MPEKARHMPDGDGIAAAVDALDWPSIGRELLARGHASAGTLLDAAACESLAALYGEDRFRSTVVMERHAYGEGEYRYFRYPLPSPVQALRQALYPYLAPVARDWASLLGLDSPFPDRLDDFLAFCRGRGQAKPTPLLLRYRAGGYNCLHQDLYGEVVFPLQVVVLLSRPGRDFTGGEFLLVESRPRAQSRAEVVPLAQGEAVIFATRFRPGAGRRGHHRVALRHGVSRVRSGHRQTLGIIFHDAS